MARLQKPDLKTIEPYDVSFAEIRSDDKWLETVQKVATAINVQFTESSNQLPFVAFKEFENLLREEKVFLFGPSGCGKSRTIVELLRSKKGTYERIFVINPSNPAGLASGRENISTLSQQFGRKDLVIWFLTRFTVSRRKARFLNEHLGKVLEKISNYLMKSYRC